MIFTYAGRVPPSVSPYRPPAAALAASPPPALSGRPGTDRSPPAHVRIANSVLHTLHQQYLLIKSV